MWMSNKNRGECPAESEPLAETQPTLRHAFKHVYGFILQAVKGDRTTADAIFARQRAQSERNPHAKQILQEIERSYHRLVEIEKWAADQQQHIRPFAHF